MREHRTKILIAAALALVVAILSATGGLPHIDLDSALQKVAERLGRGTYVLVGVLAFAETGAFIGFIAPGEFAVILGGVVAAQGEISVAILLGIVWFAAFSGDTVSFVLGSKLGRGFVLEHGPRFRLSHERFGQVERFFARHGGKTILIGRFIGLVRPLAPFIAGSSGMRYRAFAPFSILGTGLWGTTFVLLGYFSSQSLGQVTKWAGRGTFALAIALALIAGIAFCVRRLRHRDNRERVAAFFERTPVLRLFPPVLRGFWRVAGPELRFIWGRVTPGGLGLEFSTVMAALAVGVYVLTLYLVLLGGDLGPTPGDATASSVSRDIAASWLSDLNRGVTRLGAFYVVFPLSLAVSVLLAAKRRWLELWVLLGGLLLTVVAVDLLKNAVDRPRPGGALVATSGESFPSGHAAYSVAYPVLGVIAARVIPAIAARFAVVVVAVVLAAAIGLSRVYLRAHFLSDVLGGWALALAAFALCSAVVLVVGYLRQNGSPDALDPAS